jgi:hypothetical protein
MLCASCKREFAPGAPWQENCLTCWNRNWRGFPSPSELRASILAALANRWVCASDLVNRSQMAAAMWPQIALMALNGDIDVARWDGHRSQYVLSDGHCDGRAYIRRRIEKEAAA